MSGVVQINDWHVPEACPYTKLLRESRLDQDSIVAAFEACGTRRGVAIDGGAHIGTWSRPLSQMFDTVYAFEPHPGLAALFRANVPGVRVFEAGLWKKSGMMSLKAGEQNSGQAFLTGHADPDAMTYVPVIALDDMHLPMLDLLKLDIEGAEFYALQGAVHTLERFRPVVVIEQNVASQRFALEYNTAAMELEGIGYEEVDRVEFAPGEYNVIFRWN